MFLDINFLHRQPEELAQHPGDSPVIFPLKVDECMAIVGATPGNPNRWVRVGICIRKFDRSKGGSKKSERGYQKRLRMMRPRAIVVVLLPGKLASPFFSDT